MVASILPWVGPVISLITFIFLAGMKYGDMKAISRTMDRIEGKVNNHAERIARIEGCLEIQTKDKDAK